MPNRLHFICFAKEASPPLNNLMSGFKRFFAYDIVKRLESGGNSEILQKLKAGVAPNELMKGKKHQVFQPSFDAKECVDLKMLHQKLDYIHNNPVSGKWSLADDFTNYTHSSARFYEGMEAFPNFLEDFRLFT